MAPGAFAALALLASSWLTGAVRLQDDVALDGSAEDSAQGVSSVRQDSCSSEAVQDAVRCGVDRIVQEIEDGLLCGFEWCTTPPTYLCAKRCGQLVDVPRTCEILLSCSVEITLHIKAQTSTSSISGLNFDAEMEDFVLNAEGHPDLQEVVDGNKDLIMPWMKEMLDIGLPVANELLHGELFNFEAEIIAALESDIVSKNAWIARLILGGKGFQEGMKRALEQRFSEVGALVHRRYEVQAAEEGKTKGRLCDRLLKVTQKSGAEFYISDWSNAMVARTINLETNCQTAYTAHCGTGSFIATSKCPLAGEKVKKKCLFSALCWKRNRVITPKGKEVVTLYRGDHEIDTTEEVTITHIADEEAKSSASGGFGNFHTKSMAVPARSSPSANDELAELDSLIQIKDDELPGVMKNEVCKELRKNAWWGFGGFTEARCRLTFSTVYAMADVTINLPIGPSVVSADVSLRGGVFRIEMIPDWRILSEAANAAVKEQIRLATRNEPLPLGANIEQINIQLSGDGDTLFVEAYPTLTGTLTIDQIDELRNRLLS